MTHSQSNPRVLLVYYSLSGQTNGLLQRLAVGLRKKGVDVVVERLAPVTPLRFPLGSILATLRMMILTFGRMRVPIKEPSPACFAGYDLIILGGPTWSYHPSGPVLALLDQYGHRLFKDQKVVPLISCRGYWRMHWYGLRRKLRACGAQISNFMVFTHPAQEPWRTVGVFLKIAGRMPEKGRIMGRFYPRYGHSQAQLMEAEQLGEQLGKALRGKDLLTELHLRSEIAMP